MISVSRRAFTALPLLALWAFPLSAGAMEPVLAKPGVTAPATPKEGVTVADAMQEAFVSVADRLKPSVVTIYCEQVAKPKATAPKSGAKPGTKPALPEAKPAPDEEEDEAEAPSPFADPTEPRTSLGTGMVVRSDGYILTNYHVVRNADVIRVLFNADAENPDKPMAKLVGFDEESDLAVLKIPRTNLPAVTFANSDEVRIGEWAMAIGAPFDQAMTVTVGIVSAKGRHLDKKGRVGLQDYLQTDASINPGNSGGPLIDLNGKVIGVNTAILSPSRFNVGIGFAVPAKTVSRLMPLLVKGETIKRGFLGIQYVRLEDAVAKEFGVPSGMQIGALARKDGAYIGPAKDAGLKEDDIITSINGENIQSSDQFRSIVSTTPPGGVLNFGIARPVAEKLETFEVKVTLGDWNAQFGPKTAVVPVKAPEPARVGLGLELENADKLSPTDKIKFALDPKVRGAIITKVAPGSPADEGALRRGLRLVRARVDGTWVTVANVAAWQNLEKAAAPGSRLLLQLRDREEVSVYKVLVTPEAPKPELEPAATVKDISNPA